MAEQASADNESVGEITKAEIKCPKSGIMKVIIQGKRSKNETCILTLHDVGANDFSMIHVAQSSVFQVLSSRIVWFHLIFPGQENNGYELPQEFHFPSMQDLADDIGSVLDQLSITNVVLWGDGAGANVAIRYCVSKDQRILGAVLFNCNASAAGLFEGRNEKATGRRLSIHQQTINNPNVEHSIANHHFGCDWSRITSDDFKAKYNMFCQNLETINSRNVGLFLTSYSQRDAIMDRAKQVHLPLLLVCGGKSEHARSTQLLHAALQKVRSQAREKGALKLANECPVEMLCADNVVSVLEEKPEKFLEALQYFLQGLGLLAGMPIIKNSELTQASTGEASPRSGSISGSAPPHGLSMGELDQPVGQQRIRQMSHKYSGSSDSGPASPVFTASPTFFGSGTTAPASSSTVVDRARSFSARGSVSRKSISSDADGPIKEEGNGQEEGEDAQVGIAKKAAQVEQALGAGLEERLYKNNRVRRMSQQLETMYEGMYKERESKGTGGDQDFLEFVHRLAGGEAGAEKPEASSVSAKQG